MQETRAKKNPAYTKRGVICGRIGGICDVFVIELTAEEVVELCGMLVLLDVVGGGGGAFRALKTACCNVIPRNP